MKSQFMAKAAIAGMIASSLLTATPVFAATTELDFGTFTNTYTADSVSISLKGTKVLTDLTNSGKALKGDDFSFSLKDADGKTVETVKNSATGAIKFSDLTFSKPGTYTYTIVEDAGQDKHVGYSKVVKTVTITVTGKDGVLSINGSSKDTTPAATQSDSDAQKPATN